MIPRLSSGSFLSLLFLMVGSKDGNVGDSNEGKIQIVRSGSSFFLSVDFSS